MGRSQSERSGVNSRLFLYGVYYRSNRTDCNTRYVFIDQNSAGCRNPVISAYTWSKDSESGLYNFTQGNNIVQYSITFSNNDNRMTWIDQTSGDTIIWDRQVAAVKVTE